MEGKDGGPWEENCRSHKGLCQRWAAWLQPSMVQSPGGWWVMLREKPMVLWDLKSVQKAQTWNWAFIHNIILAHSLTREKKQKWEGEATGDSARDAPWTATNPSTTSPCWKGGWDRSQKVSEVQKALLGETLTQLETERNCWIVGSWQHGEHVPSPSSFMI